MRTYVAGTVFAVLLGLASLRRHSSFQPPVCRDDQGKQWRRHEGGMRDPKHRHRVGRRGEFSLLTSIESVGIFDFCNGHPLLGGQTCLVWAIFEDLGRASSPAR